MTPKSKWLGCRIGQFRCPTTIAGTLSAAACVVLLSGAPARAATADLVVGDESAQCVGPTHSTIQSAVTAAAPGDIVQVCAGTYSEQVFINKALTLRGVQAGLDARDRTADAQESILGGAVTDELPNGGGIAVNASRVTIDGFTIVDVPSAPSGISAGISVASTTGGHVFRNNIFRENAMGVYLNNTSAESDDMGLLPETRVEANLFEQPAGVDGGFGNGIYSDQGTSRVAIDQNRFTGHDNAAILLNAGVHGSEIEVTQNQMVNDAQVLVFDSDDVTISDNLSTRSTTDAIVLGGGTSNVTIARNTVDDPAENAAGIRLVESGAPALVTGIQPPPWPRDTNRVVVIEGNTLLGSGDEVGIRIGDALPDPGADVPVNPLATDNVDIRFNRIVGNGVGMELNAPNIAIDAEDNWWGCNEGPGDADCDAVGGLFAVSADTDPSLVLSFDAPASARPDQGPVELSADLMQTSGSAPALAFPDGTDIAFTTSFGTIESPGRTVGGRAATRLHPADPAQTEVDAAIEATLDAATIDATVTMLDVVAPEVEIDSGPENFDLIADPRPPFEFSANESSVTYECRFVPLPDPVPSPPPATPDFEMCSGPAGRHTPGEDSPLDEGRQRFEVRAKDGSKNLSASATRTFTLDSVKPSAPKLTGAEPIGPANDNEPEIIGSAEAHSTVTLYATGNCAEEELATEPADEFGGFDIAISVPDDSSTAITATARDVAGNVSACSAVPLVYIEDSSVAETEIVSGPNSPTNAPIYEFSSPHEDAVGFECRVDSVPESEKPVDEADPTEDGFVDCESPYRIENLEEGAHRFEVRAVDQAGNRDATTASGEFVLDVTPPEPPSIDSSSPASYADENEPKLSGIAEGGSTVRVYVGIDCAGESVVDGTAMEFLAPGLTVSVQDDSSTEFHATAADGAGNVSACSPAFTYIHQSAHEQEREASVDKVCLSAREAFAGECFVGTPGRDRFAGGDGDDLLFGGAGGDTLDGAGGNDWLRAGAGRDELTGGEGRDILSGGTGPDMIDAADGHRDRVVCGGGRRDQARVDDRDEVRGCERVDTI